MEVSIWHSHMPFDLCSVNCFRLNLNFHPPAVIDDSVSSQPVLVPIKLTWLDSWWSGLDLRDKKKWLRDQMLHVFTVFVWKIHLSNGVTHKWHRIEKILSAPLMESCFKKCCVFCFRMALLTAVNSKNLLLLVILLMSADTCRLSACFWSVAHGVETPEITNSFAYDMLTHGHAHCLSLQLCKLRNLTTVGIQKSWDAGYNINKIDWLITILYTYWHVLN